MTTTKDVMLQAFDRLYDRAAKKLKIEITPEDKNESKRQFSERSAVLLKGLEQLPVKELPEDVIGAMEEAIDHIRAAEVVGLLASIPIAHQTQEILRTLAYRATEQRLLEHLISQADESFGGN